MGVVVIAGAALGAAESPGDPLDQDGVVHAQFDHGVDAGAARLQHGVQRLRLGHGAGEAVQDEAIGAVGLLDALADHGDEHLVRHQSSLSHDLLGAEADLAARRHLGAQHVPGGDLSDAVASLQPLRLGAFPAPGGPSRMMFNVPSLARGPS